MLEHLFYMPQLACNLQLRLRLRLRLLDDRLGADGCIEVILRHAGKDATAAYNEVHPPSLLNDHLAPSKRIGKLDASTLPPSWLQQPQQQSPPAPSPSSLAAASTKPPLKTLISSHSSAHPLQEDVGVLLVGRDGPGDGESEQSGVRPGVVAAAGAV